MRALTDWDRRLAQIRYRKACTSFPDDPDRQRAALLRDVGKGRPTIGQAFLALLVARLAPRSLHRWQLRGDNSFLAQVGRLARHREAGGDLLELAGSSPRVVEFVRARKLR